MTSEGYGMDGQAGWHVDLGRPGPASEALAGRVIAQAIARGWLPSDVAPSEGAALLALRAMLDGGRLGGERLGELVELLAAVDVACPACGGREAGVRQVVPGDLGSGDGAAAVEVFGALPAERLGRYELRRQVGRGGMGIVLEGWDPSLERSVAIKVLRRGEDAKGRARLEREAVVIASLRHPNIIPVHEVALAGEDDVALSYLVMDFVDGPSLADAMPGMSGGRVLDVAIQVSEALGYAHAKGVIHRDIKPANVLMQGDMAMVVDFGLARAIDDVELRTASGVAVGTLAYMSPEQLEGRREHVDARSDVWSLGVSLYEMMTGRLPFEGRTAIEVMHRILCEDAVPPRRRLAGVARDLEAICLKALERDRGRRYEDAGAMAADLRRFRDGEPVLARPPGRIRRAYRALSRRPAAVMGTLCALLVGLALGLHLWSFEQRHADLRSLAKAARERGDWDECIAACRQATQLRVDEELAGWAEGAERERAARLERDRLADERRTLLDRLGASTALIEATRPYFYIPDYDIAARIDALRAELMALMPLASDPRYARESRLYGVLGVGWLMLDDHETAQGYLRRAVELDPTDAFIHRELGRLYLLRGVRDVLLTTTTSGFEANRAKPHLDAAEAGGYAVGLERDQVVALSHVARFDAEAARALCHLSLERHAGEIGSEMFQVLLGGLTEDRQAREALFESALQLRPHFAWLMLGLAQSIPYGELERKLKYALAAENINKKLIGVNRVIALCYSRFGFSYNSSIYFRRELDVCIANGSSHGAAIARAEFVNYCIDKIGKRELSEIVSSIWRFIANDYRMLKHDEKERITDTVFLASVEASDYIGASICMAMMRNLMPASGYYEYRHAYMRMSVLGSTSIDTVLSDVAKRHGLDSAVFCQCQALALERRGDSDCLAYFDTAIGNDINNIGLWHKKIDALISIGRLDCAIDTALSVRDRFKCGWGCVFDDNIIRSLIVGGTIDDANAVIHKMQAGDRTPGDKMFACRLLAATGQYGRCRRMFASIEADFRDRGGIWSIYSNQISYAIGKSMSIEYASTFDIDASEIGPCNAAFEMCVESLAAGDGVGLNSNGIALARFHLTLYHGHLFSVMACALRSNILSVSNTLKHPSLISGNGLICEVSAALMSADSNMYNDAARRFEQAISCHEGEEVSSDIVAVLMMYGVCMKKYDMAIAADCFRRALACTAGKHGVGDRRFRIERALISGELAKIIFNNGLKVEAYGLMRRSIAELRSNYGSKLAMTYMLLKDGRYVDAVNEINAALVHQDGYGELMFLRGRAFSAIGCMIQGESDIKMAFCVLPAIAESGYVKNDASMALARLARRFGRGSDWIHSIAICDGDRDGAAYLAKGCAFTEIGNDISAARAFKQSLDCGMRIAVLLDVARDLKSRGRTSLAVALLRLIRERAEPGRMDEIDRRLGEMGVPAER